MMSLPMRIWIDLANSPHVPFFRALIPEFHKRGHEVEITARDFAETVPLAEVAGLNPKVIGGHGGRKITGKAGNLLGRARALWSWARGRSLDLAVSHNSYSQIIAARALGLRSVTLMDYEYQPANHLAFRLATRIIVPQAFPEAALRRYGAVARKVRRYEGTKEDVYLADFQPDPNFPAQLAKLGISGHDVLAVVRPPASEALYHRFENELFDELLEWLAFHASLKIVLLPRNEAQRSRYAARACQRLIMPLEPLDGPNLISSSDLIVSAGGTMNREAAALGVPAATIYAGKWAAIDEALVREGRLLRISARQDFEKLTLEKKQDPLARRASQVRSQVADLIVES
jgi:uncharacterized protein